MSLAAIKHSVLYQRKIILARCVSSLMPDAPVQSPQQPGLRDWWNEYSSKVGDEWNEFKKNWTKGKKTGGQRGFDDGTGQYW